MIEEQPSAPPRKTKTCKTKPPGPVSTAGTDLLPGQVSSSPVLLRPVPSTRRSIRPSELHSPTSLCDFPAFFLPAEPSLISNPFVPLHLEDVQDPYSFSLSDVSMDDLEMNLCVATLAFCTDPDPLYVSRLTFLSHRLSFGFQLPFAKQQAILMKDTSGTFINPFFVHFSHMFGPCSSSYAINSFTHHMSSSARMPLLSRKASCNFINIPPRYAHATMLGIPPSDA